MRLSFEVSAEPAERLAEDAVAAAFSMARIVSMSKVAALWASSMSARVSLMYASAPCERVCARASQSARA